MHRVQLTGTKLLSAEGGTCSSRTPRPYRASQNKRFIAMTPCERSCCCQTWNRGYKSWERRYAPTLSPDLPAQRRHRGFFLPFCPLSEPKPAAKECACCTDCLCSTEQNRKSRCSRSWVNTLHRTALQVETISPLLLSSERNSIPVSPSKTIFP